MEVKFAKSSSDDRTRKTRAAFFVAAALVIYVLASGPAQWVRTDKAAAPTEWHDPPPSLWRWDENVDRIMYPLAWLADHPLADAVLTPYWNFCDDVGG